MEAWSREEFEARLRKVGAHAYHDRHPFHRRMMEGSLSRDDLRRWVANRYHYQKTIPIKDAVLLSRIPDREVRQVWVQRILDHDGVPGQPGGIERWLRLGEAVGLAREELEDERHLLPAVRFAVDAYVTFVATRPWIDGVATSLTELFAPGLMARRTAALERLYPWMDRSGLEYFRTRLEQAPRDSEHALGLVLSRARTRAEQEGGVAALRWKCDMLWAQLDALDHATRPKPRESGFSPREAAGTMTVPPGRAAW